MPAPPGVEYANSVGVGVVVSDRDNSVVTYLDTIITRMKTIRDLSSASSISIKVNQYAGQQTDQRAEQARVTTRRRATQEVVRDETRQLSLLDQLDERMAHRERERARLTADVLINTGKRVTGALQQSLQFEEQLRAQHIAKVKAMTLEQLKAADISAGGRDPHIVEQLARHKEALGRRHGDPNLPSQRVQDPETGKRYSMVGSQEQQYEQARQALRGRADLQKHLPYLEKQIEAHRKGLYTGPLGDIPREGGDVEFKLPPEGHPHRGPGTGGPQPPATARFGDLQHLTDEEAEKAVERHRKNREKGQVIDDLRNEEERDEVKRALDRRATNRRIASAVKEIEGQAAGPPPDVRAATEQAHRKTRERAETVDNLRQRELDEEARRFNERRNTTKLVRDRAAQLARDEKSQDPAYAADLRRRLSASDRGTVEASSEKLQERRGRERDALEQFNRNAVALELRKRRESEGRPVRRDLSTFDPFAPAPPLGTGGLPRRGPIDIGTASASDVEAAAEEALNRRAARSRARAGEARTDPEKERLKKERAEIAREIVGLRQKAAEVSASGGPALDKLSDQMRKLRGEAGKISLRRAGTEVAHDADKMTQHLRATQQEIRRLHGEFQKPAKDRNVIELERDMLRLQERIRDTERDMRKLRESEQDTGGGPGGGPGGPRRPQGIYQRGLFGIGGGSTGGILATALTYQAFSKIEQGLVSITRLSWEAARSHTEATLRLQAEALASGRMADENMRLANTVKTRYNVNLQTAADVVSGTTRFAERGGIFSKQGQLQNSLLDIAATRNVTAEQLPEFIQTAQNEEGRFAQKFLGKRIETIYRDYVKENREKLTEGLWDSEMVNNSQASLRALTESLTDYERAQALANEIMKKGAEYSGAAAERANSSVGNIDRTRVAFDDLAASFGQFLQSNRLIVNFLTTTATIVRGLIEDAHNLPQGQLFLSDADIDARVNKAREVGGTRVAELALNAVAGTVEVLPVMAIKGTYEWYKGGSFNEGAREVGQSYLDTFRNAPADRAAEELRQQLQRERMRSFQEGVKAGRIKLTGEPLDIGAGQGFEIVDEREAALARDAQLAKENDERRADIVEEQRLTRVRAAIQKILEARQGSQTVATVAQQLEPDNRFTKTFVDLATAGERVRTQYGALGEEVVTLMTKFEMQALRVQFVTQRFDSLTAAIQLQTKAAKERDEAELSTDLTRSEQARTNTVKAQVDARRQLIELEGRWQRVLGVGPGLLGEPEFAAREQISDLLGLGGPGVGMGLESRAQKRIINDAVLDILGTLPDTTLADTPWAREAFTKAVEGKMYEARSAVFDAFNAEALIARENDRLKQSAERYTSERDRALEEASSEVERRAVGRAFDRALIQQTEGVGGRELAQLGLFDYRNEAIMREAQRVTEEQARAAAAQQEGLQVQRGIFYAVAAIAGALRGGDMSLLVRIENMTRATVDTQDMQSTSPADVQRLLGSGEAAIDTAGLNDRYGRSRRKE